MKKSIMLLSVVLIATLITACHIDEAAEYTVNPILTLEDEDAVKAKLNEITADDRHIYIPFQGYDPEFEEQRPQDGGIFKMCKDSGEIVRISYDSAFGLIECNGYLYYFNEHDSNHLYRMKTDGTERSKFVELEYGTGRAYSYNGCQLYFSPGETDWNVGGTSIGKTYVMDLVTGEYEEILPMHALDFHVSDPWIYFTPASDYQQIMDGLIWRIKGDGTSLEEVAEGIEFPRVMIDDENYLYMKYILRNFGEGGYSKLIKFNVESGEEEDLYTFPEGVRSFFFNDGWLYWGSLSGIFRSDKDNTEEIQLPSEHTTDVTRSVLGVEGEWLFYTVSIRPPHKDFESYVSKFGQHKQLHAVKVDGSKHVVINPDFDY
ncbi:MAG: DUF5050 domain-containing protein [Bacillota bacterium]|jgi:hypothetical protein